MSLRKFTPRAGQVCYNLEDDIVLDGACSVYEDPSLVLKGEAGTLSGAGPMWNYLALVYVRGKAQELVRIDLQTRSPCTVTYSGLDRSLVFEYTREEKHHVLKLKLKSGPGDPERVLQELSDWRKFGLCLEPQDPKLEHSSAYMGCQGRRSSSVVSSLELPSPVNPPSGLARERQLASSFRPISATGLQSSSPRNPLRISSPPSRTRPATGTGILRVTKIRSTTPTGLAPVTGRVATSESRASPVSAQPSSKRRRRLTAMRSMTTSRNFGATTPVLGVPRQPALTSIPEIRDSIARLASPQQPTVPSDQWSSSPPKQELPPVNDSARQHTVVRSPASQGLPGSLSSLSEDKKAMPPPPALPLSLHRPSANNDTHNSVRFEQEDDGGSVSLPCDPHIVPRRGALLKPSQMFQITHEALIKASVATRQAMLGGIDQRRSSSARLIKQYDRWAQHLRVETDMWVAHEIRQYMMP